MSILSTSQLTSTYPATNLERDQWILERRPARETLDPQKPYLFFVEQELSASGEILPVATIFLTNRECPWRCVMCDLWRNTLTTSVPPGAIPAQIDFALSQLPAARVLKLYNSGSFFDSRAIPVEDHPAIAERANNFERLIVENHPALVDDDCLRFRDRLKCRLEIAMGLETVHPDILPKLNKRMTLDQFSAAAAFLRVHDIDLRVFVLVQPPFMQPSRSCSLGAALCRLRFRLRRDRSHAHSNSRRQRRDGSLWLLISNFHRLDWRLWRRPSVMAWA